MHRVTLFYNPLAVSALLFRLRVAQGNIQYTAQPVELIHALQHESEMSQIEYPHSSEDRQTRYGRQFLIGPIVSGGKLDDRIDRPQCVILCLLAYDQVDNDQLRITRPASCQCISLV
jgi:hypothetical protein